MKQTTIIAGLPVHTYTTPGFSASTKPIFALFFLHGRLESAEHPRMQAITASLLKAVEEAPGEKDLIIISFDHRNHGVRLRAEVNNQMFEENSQHALDMYSIAVGTAQDVSFLIDFLPAYLFPRGERTIAEWGVTGISLGGHSTWMVAAADARVTVAIPIIGCPDYLALLGPRAESKGIAVAPPHFPDSLLKMWKEKSVTALPYASRESGNPFLGKKVFVLSGGADKLVPWVASKQFVEDLEVGGKGVKESIVYSGVGHEVPEPMQAQLVKYVVALL